MGVPPLDGGAAGGAEVDADRLSSEIVALQRQLAAAGPADAGALKDRLTEATKRYRTIDKLPTWPSTSARGGSSGSATWPCSCP